MSFHPLTHMVVAAGAVLLAVALPMPAGAAVLGILLSAAALLPTRTDARLTGAFLRLIAIAAFFLFLLHGVTWSPPGVTITGLGRALEAFIRIAAPFAAVLYLSKRISGDEFYALLIDLRVPPVVIFILFRTLWLIPRMSERMREALTAQKMRGMPAESALQRARAVIPSLSPVFSSMVDETSRHALVITARGFLRPGPKTHALPLRFEPRDVIAVSGTVALTAILLILS